GGPGRIGAFLHCRRAARFAMPRASRGEDFPDLRKNFRRSRLPVVHDSANLPRGTAKIRGSSFTHPCEFSIHNPSRVGGNRPATLGEQQMSQFKRFLRDESGATAIEYGPTAPGISVAIIATVNTLGGQLKNTFSNVSSQLGNAGK